MGFTLSIVHKTAMGFISAVVHICFLGFNRSLVHKAAVGFMKILVHIFFSDFKRTLVILQIPEPSQKA